MGVAATHAAKFWLMTGTFGEIDLYWFVADTSCLATDFRARGFEGMTLCRE